MARKRKSFTFGVYIKFHSARSVRSWPALPPPRSIAQSLDIISHYYISYHHLPLAPSPINLRIPITIRIGFESDFNPDSDSDDSHIPARQNGRNLKGKANNVKGWDGMGWDVP